MAFVAPLVVALDAGLAALSALDHWGRNTEIRSQSSHAQPLPGAQYLSGLWFSRPDTLVSVREQAGRVAVQRWSVSEGQPPAEVMVDLREWTAVAVSPEGRLAVAIDDGTVRLSPPAGPGSAGPDVFGAYNTLVAPGVVGAMAFHDERRIIVGGDFRGIYLISEDAPPQELVPDVLVKRLAFFGPHLVYPDVDRLAFATLSSIRPLNQTGRAIGLSWILIAIALLAVPAIRLRLAGRARLDAGGAGIRGVLQSEARGARQGAERHTAETGVGRRQRATSRGVSRVGFRAL